MWRTFNYRERRGECIRRYTEDIFETNADVSSTFSKATVDTSNFLTLSFTLPVKITTDREVGWLIRPSYVSTRGGARKQQNIVLNHFSLTVPKFIATI